MDSFDVNSLMTEQTAGGERAPVQGTLRTVAWARRHPMLMATQGSPQLLDAVSWTRRSLAMDNVQVRVGYAWGRAKHPVVCSETSERFTDVADMSDVH